jgi:hypothetical protein
MQKFMHPVVDRHAFAGCVCVYRSLHLPDCKFENMFISFKRLLLCFLFLGITTKLFSQDTTQFRLERFENLKNCLYELQINSNKLINWYKSYKLISPKIYKDLEEKIKQFDKSIKSKTVLDSFYIRRVGDNYEDLTQLIISVYDSLAKASKIPKTKREIGDFFNSYFKAEDTIDLYDDLNWNNQNLLFRIYAKRYLSLI